MSFPDLSVVIACYQEEEALPRLFSLLAGLERRAAARGVAPELVFVDDGSTDGTAAGLRAFCAEGGARRWISHPGNRGFGAAMRTGFAAARGEVVVCYDADATYPVEDVLRLRHLLLATGADVAGASPFAADGEVSAGPVRTLLSRTVAGLYGLALRGRARGLTAFTCAFRAYRREALAGVRVRADGFLAAAELLSRLLLRDARVVETGSTLSARREGRSKMKVVRTALAHLRFLLRVAGRAGDLAVRPRPPGRGRGGPVPVREVPDDPLAWNRTLNRAHPMRGIERHPNPLVRAVEERRRRTVIRLAALPPGRWVVDVGAEEGAYVPRIAAAGARPLTVDLDPEVLGRGRARHGAPAVAADAARLPFRDGAVPRVILAEVLEHCPDPAAALSEALRIVPAAGRVALSVPDDGPIVAAKRALLRLGLGRLFAGLPPDLAPGHIYVFTRASLRSLLESAGRLRSLTRDPFALAFFAVVAPRREDG